MLYNKIDKNKGLGKKMSNKKKKLILGAIISIVIFDVVVNSIQFVINNREKDLVQDVRSNPFNKKDKKEIEKRISG